MKTGMIITGLALFSLTAFGCTRGRQESERVQTEHETQHTSTAADTMREPVLENLPGYGEKCWISDSLYFTYKFDKRPEMGTAILIVRVFDAVGEQSTTLGITGSSDMPSMRGAHDSGEVPLKLNKKGDYLMPVNIVMPGEWEVKLVFMKGEEVLYRGRFVFKV